MKKIIIMLCVLSFPFFFINPMKKLTYAVDNQIYEKQELTIDDAKELLLKYNNKVDYIYQGDANDFNYLKSKNFKGYVFLPNVDTDIGYFVDKETSNIYFFHPSGYLELVK